MRNVSKTVFYLLGCFFLFSCASSNKSAKELSPYELRQARELGLLDQNGLANGDSTIQDNPDKPRVSGLLRIKRHTDSYSMDMVLDAAGDNIYFMMDPEEINQVLDQMGKKEKASGNIIADPEKYAENVAKSGKHIIYAQSYLYENKYQRALQEVNRALELNPQSSIGYQLKGSIFYRLNDKQEAKEAWKKALEIDPALDEVKVYLNKLDNEEASKAK